MVGFQAGKFLPKQTKLDGGKEKNVNTTAWEREFQVNISQIFQESGSLSLH